MNSSSDENDGETSLCFDKGAPTDAGRSSPSFPAEFLHLPASRIKEFSSIPRNQINQVTCKITVSLGGRVHNVITGLGLPNSRQMREGPEPPRGHSCDISTPTASPRVLRETSHTHRYRAFCQTLEQEFHLGGENGYEKFQAQE